VTNVVALGLDAGSTTTKLVGVDEGGAIAWTRIQPTEPRMAIQAERMLAESPAAAGLPVVATGYGRALVAQAAKSVTEITCHGRGVHRSLGHGGTLIDIGGQDTKVILIGKDGRVLNFAMNDKCAAGTGRFLEVVARRMLMELSEFAQIAADCTGEVSISNTCTVFAESEIVSLLAGGEEPDRIARGLHRSLVRRIAAMARGVGVTAPVLVSGGGAKNPALVGLLGDELKQKATVPDNPQLMGAYGAALVALDL